MKSLVLSKGAISLPMVEGEHSMIPFNLDDFAGLTGDFLEIAKNMMQDIKHQGGISYFTIHGQKLKKGQTLRRGGAHTDGNYEPHLMTFGGGGGNGWKVGESGHKPGHPTHQRQYVKDTGGIVIASNYRACNGWVGEFEGVPGRGGDCSHIQLNDHFELKANEIYYGNNHFIHESLAMKDDVHRVFARITMPENHVFEGN
ncbi:MAG: hypothetical protein GY907_03280 [Bacteroidetes bacterium]|nr:hypothetical protein [Bacteroidota bacterium]